MTKLSISVGFKLNLEDPFTRIDVRSVICQAQTKTRLVWIKIRDKTLRGIFAGYIQRAGGGWSGDLKVYDWEQMENSEHISDVHPRTIKGAEVFPTMYGNSFHFPLAEGDLKQPDYGRQRKPRKKRKRGGRAQRDGTILDEPEEETERPPDVEIVDKDNYVCPEGGDSSEMDFWTINNDVLIRHHRIPRISLFVPTPDNCPVPLDYIDVMRESRTDIEDDEREIKDYWYDADPRNLSSAWTGSTLFWLLKPKPPPGQMYVQGRLTKIQKTTRPASVRTEEWIRMSKNDQTKEIELWRVESAKRDQARREIGLWEIPEGEVDEYVHQMNVRS